MKTQSGTCESDAWVTIGNVVCGAGPMHGRILGTGHSPAQQGEGRPNLDRHEMTAGANFC